MPGVTGLVVAAARSCAEVMRYLGGRWALGARAWAGTRAVTGAGPVAFYRPMGPACCPVARCAGRDDGALAGDGAADAVTFESHVSA
jgi:hypothetical protein